MSKATINNYAHLVLAWLRHGPQFATELPCPHHRVPETICKINKDIAAAGWKITGRWVNVPGKFFKHKERCYTLERL